MRQLLGPNVLHQVGMAHAQVITGKSFFPSFISGPFHSGLEVAVAASAVLCGLAAGFSRWAGDRRATSEQLSEALAHESFVDGHSARGARRYSGATLAGSSTYGNCSPCSGSTWKRSGTSSTARMSRTASARSAGPLSPVPRRGGVSRWYRHLSDGRCR